MQSEKIIYKLVMCEKFDEKTKPFIDYGQTDEVGIFDDKQLCIQILKNNTLDVCSTIYNYAYIEEIYLNSLYFGTGDKDVYKVENVLILNQLGEQRYNPNCYYEFYKKIKKNK